MRRPALTASNVSLKSPSPCSMDLIPMVRVLGIAALGRLFHVRHEIRDETSDVAERIRLFEPLHVTVMPLRRGRRTPPVRVRCDARTPVDTARRPDSSAWSRPSKSPDPRYRPVRR